MLSAVISVRSTNFDGNIIRQRNSRPEEDLLNQTEGNDEANTSLALNEPLNLVFLTTLLMVNEDSSASLLKKNQRRFITIKIFWKGKV